MKNSDSLASPADLHQTLMHLISLESDSQNQESLIQINKNKQSDYSLSLFTPISPQRTCDQARVDSHWCACMKRNELEVDAYLVRMAESFVEYVNKEILGRHMKKCRPLRLESVTRVYLLESTIDLKYASNRSAFDFLDLSKLNLLKPPPVEQDYQKYLFQVVLRPSKAYFEFTVEMENKLNEGAPLPNDIKVKINKDKISRIDKYGNSSQCIAEQYPDLRKYCYCRRT